MLRAGDGWEAGMTSYYDEIHEKVLREMLGNK